MKKTLLLLAISVFLAFFGSAQTGFNPNDRKINWLNGVAAGPHGWSAEWHAAQQKIDNLLPDVLTANKLTVPDSNGQLYSLPVSVEIDTIEFEEGVYIEAIVTISSNMAGLKLPLFSYNIAEEFGEEAEINALQILSGLFVESKPGSTAASFYASGGKRIAFPGLIFKPNGELVTADGLLYNTFGKPVDKDSTVITFGKIPTGSTSSESTSKILYVPIDTLLEESLAISGRTLYEMRAAIDQQVALTYESKIDHQLDINDINSRIEVLDTGGLAQKISEAFHNTEKNFPDSLRSLGLGSNSLRDADTLKTQNDIVLGAGYPYAEITSIGNNSGIRAKLVHSTLVGYGNASPVMPSDDSVRTYLDHFTIIGWRNAEAWYNRPVRLYEGTAVGAKNLEMARYAKNVFVNGNDLLSEINGVWAERVFANGIGWGINEPDSLWQSLYWGKVTPANNSMTFCWECTAEENVFKVGFDITDFQMDGINWRSLWEEALTKANSAHTILDNTLLDTRKEVLDFPLTGNLNSADLTITYSGAIEGDPVVIGVPKTAVLTNSCYTAWVSNSDQVTIRFNNYADFSQDPASGTFSVKIIK